MGQTDICICGVYVLIYGICHRSIYFVFIVATKVSSQFVGYFGSDPSALEQLEMMMVLALEQLEMMMVLALEKLEMLMVSALEQLFHNTVKNILG